MVYIQSNKYAYELDRIKSLYNRDLKSALEAQKNIEKAVVKHRLLGQNIVLDASGTIWDWDNNTIIKQMEGIRKLYIRTDTLQIDKKLQVYVNNGLEVYIDERRLVKTNIEIYYKYSHIKQDWCKRDIESLYVIKDTIGIQLEIDASDCSTEELLELLAIKFLYVSYRQYEADKNVFLTDDIDWRTIGIREILENKEEYDIFEYNSNLLEFYRIEEVSDDIKLNAVRICSGYIEEHKDNEADSTRKLEKLKMIIAWLKISEYNEAVETREVERLKNNIIQGGRKMFVVATQYDGRTLDSLRLLDESTGEIKNIPYGKVVNAIKLNMVKIMNLQISKGELVGVEGELKNYTKIDLLDRKFGDDAAVIIGATYETVTIANYEGKIREIPIDTLKKFVANKGKIANIGLYHKICQRIENQREKAAVEGEEERVKQERERQEKKRQEKERQEKERQKQLEEKAKQERIRQEQLKQEQLKQEQLKQELARQEQERQEQLRSEKEKQQKLKEAQKKADRNKEIKGEELENILTDISTTLLVRKYKIPTLENKVTENTNFKGEEGSLIDKIAKDTAYTDKDTLNNFIEAEPYKERKDGVYGNAILVLRDDNRSYSVGLSKLRDKILVKTEKGCILADDILYTGKAWKTNRVVKMAKEEDTNLIIAGLTGLFVINKAKITGISYGRLLDEKGIKHALGRLAAKLTSTDFNRINAIANSRRFMDTEGLTEGNIDEFGFKDVLSMVEVDTCRIQVSNAIDTTQDIMKVMDKYLEFGIDQFTAAIIHSEMNFIIPAGQSMILYYNKAKLLLTHGIKDSISKKYKSFSQLFSNRTIEEIGVGVMLLNNAEEIQKYDIDKLKRVLTNKLKGKMTLKKSIVAYNHTSDGKLVTIIDRYKLQYNIEKLLQVVSLLMLEEESEWFIR